jgi:hypothetical protein
MHIYKVQKGGWGFGDVFTKLRGAPLPKPFDGEKKKEWKGKERKKKHPHCIYFRFLY